MPPEVALVTGAASGMGRILALRMAQGGTQVAAMDLDAEALDALCGDSANIHPYTCDVTEPAAVVATVRQVTATLGPIDRLAHCAAIMPAGALADQALDSLQRLMTVNYGGTANVVRAVLPDMQARNRGELVVFGSLGGYVPVPGCGAYCASKAAVNTFAEILIEENRDSAVHIMLVCPPLVDTPLLQQATATGNPKTVRDSIANRRFADPASIIDAVEKGLAKGTNILYPNAEARILGWLRRFSPRLLWRVIHAANRE